MILPTTSLKWANILIVDDEIANVRLLEMILNDGGYTNVFGIIEPTQLFSILGSFHPDVILLDLSMPSMDGFEVMQRLSLLDGGQMRIPVLVLTADISRATRHRALKEGAQDFLVKPFDDVEVLLRVENLLRVKLHSQLLEATVKDRTEKLTEAHLKSLERLAIAAEFRDDDTGMHTRRVGDTSSRIAKALGHSPEFVESIKYAAPLHDVGKIGIPDAILLKPGKLTPEEFHEMKRHTTIGGKILSGSASPLVQLAKVIAETHHERWDGTGYIGLVGEEIPLPGRIVSVADVFDALVNERPYKKAWPPELAMAEVEAQSGRQFDPKVVSAFLSLRTDDLLVHKD
jgi:putative two-component system response regulator